MFFEGIICIVEYREQMSTLVFLVNPLFDSDSLAQPLQKCPGSVIQ